MKDQKISLKDAIKMLNKKHGSNTIKEINDDDERGKIESISTGCYSLDKVFGCGGCPRGRIIDVFGLFSSGKSTMAMYIVGQIQKTGGKAAWIDSEMCFSTEYAKKIGVDTNTLLLSQPETCEMALDTVEKLVHTGELDIIVIDSTAALVPAVELDNYIEKVTVALQARLMSKGLRMITGVASRSKTIIMFISQVRDKIGVFMGPTQSSTGGKALSFYSSVRLKVSKIKTLKGKGDVVIGNRLKIEAVKNKVGLPFRKAEIDLDFEKGIGIVADILDCAVNDKIIERVGSTYTYKNLKLGVGRDKVITFMENDKNLFKEIKKKLINK